jgi:hypothetical protein
VNPAFSVKSKVFHVGLSVALELCFFGDHLSVPTTNQFPMTAIQFDKVICALGFALGTMHLSTSLATADGPDFYKVQGAPDGNSLPLRGTPDASTPLGFIPVNAECVRNLGCQGGLSLQEFTSLSDKEKAERLATNPRWCKVDYQGQTGWVQGQYLAEAPCANADSATRQLPVGPKPLVVKGSIKGYLSADYRIKVFAGQTLTVSLTARHPQAYFNVFPSGSQEAIFVGSSTGNKALVVIPMDGEYTLQVYLMRAAARRGATSKFTLTASLQGQALPAIASSKDALVPGTPFHATAHVKCSPPYSAIVTSCEAGVIRRSLDGTATVQVRWPQGVRHILFFKGKAIASDSARPITSTKTEDMNKVTIGGDEVLDIPDVLLTGG